MKKVLAVAVLTLASIPAMAQHYHHGHRSQHFHYKGPHHGYHGGGWVAPLIIGGVVTYALTRPEPVVIQQPPIIVQPNPTVLQNPTCTPWTETQNADGTITRSRTCTQ